MASSKAIVQDMPPAGGYKPLNWQKTIRPPVLGGAGIFGLYAANFVAWFGFWRFFLHKYEKRDEFEMLESRIALEPFMVAENDRSFLKRCWINREEERVLMKDVPGWEVGTWFGEPVYLDTSQFLYPSTHEYYVHSNPKAKQARLEEKFWH